MRRRPRLAVGAALAACAAACQLLAGIDEKQYAEPPRAAPDAAAAPSVDPCAHAEPPAPPAANEDPVTKLTYVLAVSSLELTTERDGGAVGYDLDGVCTCFGDPGTRHDGGPSCAAPSGIPCDGDRGVDNALGAMLTSRQEFLPIGQQFVANDEIRCGKQTLLIYLTGYNGRANDARVELSPIRANGVYTAHEGGEVDAGCGPRGPEGPFPPRWDGTDTWTYDPADVYDGPTFVPLRTSAGYVTDGQLVVRGDATSVPFTFAFGSLSIAVGSPTLTATLVPVEVDGGAPPADGGAPPALKLVRGTLAGRTSTRAVLTSLAAARVMGSFLCGSNLLYQQLKGTLCPTADIMSDPLRDFLPESRCDAISMAATFEARPALLGAPRVRPPVDAGCGPSWEDDCEPRARGDAAATRRAAARD